MTDPIRLRGYVREVLALAPRREFTERMIFDGVDRLVGGGLKLAELQKAMEWNHGKNLIEFRYCSDTEENLWSLTKQGKSKEGVK